MTIALIGVGVDDTNSEPYPQMYDDGTFEYVPIPEAHDTVSEMTYESLARHHTGGQLRPVGSESEAIQKVLNKIYPREDDGEILTGRDLATHPVHHDPNFDALTYGEIKTANQNKIEQLNPESDDVIPFYTGLTLPNDSTPH